MDSECWRRHKNTHRIEMQSEIKIVLPEKQFEFKKIFLNLTWFNEIFRETIFISKFYIFLVVLFRSAMFNKDSFQRGVPG